MRTYLDYNSTVPLRSEAKKAMIDAMNVVGNPSSVHLEGRAAKALIEDARIKIAEAIGAVGADIIFTSGATESAALALSGRDIMCSKVEHDAVTSWCAPNLSVDDLEWLKSPSQNILRYNLPILKLALFKSLLKVFG